jgi:hypothetical protein
MGSRETVQKDLATIEQCMAFWSLKRTSAVVAVLVTCLWAFYSIMEARWFDGMLPAALQTKGSAIVRHDASLFAIILSVRYKSCGGATYGLSRRTLSAIDSQGLAFFAQARRSRAVTHRRAGLPLAYQPWRPTPVPPEWTSEGMWLGLACMGWTWSRNAIYAAARGPGSYYTTTDNAQLLVIPSLGLAVFTFRGL